VSNWGFSPDVSPREVVREILRRSPHATFVEVEAAWRALHGETDLAQLRAEYDQELAERSQRRHDPRERQHGRKVLRTAALWIVGHLLVAVLLGLRGYLECRGGPPPNFFFGSCGVNLGLMVVLIGLGQLVWGVAVGLSLRRQRPAVAQGILIGTAVFILATPVVCFWVSFV
jgi:hypothetical protein